MSHHKNIYISRVSNIIAWLGFIWVVGLTIIYSFVIFHFDSTSTPLKMSHIYRALQLYSPYLVSILFNYILVGSARFKPWSKRGGI